MEQTSSTPEQSQRAKQAKNRDAEAEAWFTEERMERFAACFEAVPSLWRAAHILGHEKSSRWTQYMKLLDSLGELNHTITDELSLQAKAIALCRVFSRMLREKLRWAAGESLAGGTGQDVALALCPSWARRAEGYLRLLPLIFLYKAKEKKNLNPSKPGRKPKEQKSKEEKNKVIEPAAPPIVNNDTITEKAAEPVAKTVPHEKGRKKKKTTRKKTKSVKPLVLQSSLEKTWRPSADGRLLMRRVVCCMRRAAAQCGGLTREAAAVVARRIGNTEQLVYSLWCSMRQLTMHKLQTLLARGDIPSKSEAARLGYLDWAVADLLLLYEFSPVTEASYTNNNQQHALLMTFHLVVRFSLEPAPGRQPAPHAWRDAAEYYCKGRVVMSAVALQRRWHEMKRDTRERLRAHLRGDPHVEVLPIHRTIATRYPHVVTYPPRPWSELVAEGKVAKPTMPNPPRKDAGNLECADKLDDDGDVDMVDDAGPDETVQDPSNDVMVLDDSNEKEPDSNDSNLIDNVQHIDVQSNVDNSSYVPAIVSNTIDYDKEIIDLDALSDEASDLQLPPDVCNTIEEILFQSNGNNTIEKILFESNGNNTIENILFESNTKNSTNVQEDKRSTKIAKHSNISQVTKNKSGPVSNSSKQTSNVCKAGARDLFKAIEREMFRSRDENISKIKESTATQNCAKSNNDTNESVSGENKAKYPMLTQMLQYTCIFDDDEKFNDFIENSVQNDSESNSKTSESFRTEDKNMNKNNTKIEPERKERRRKRAWHEVHSDWADQIVKAVKKQRQESERLQNSPIHKMVTVDQIDGVINRVSKICESNNIDGGKIEKILRSYLVSTISQKEVIDLEKADGDQVEDEESVAGSEENYDYQVDDDDDRDDDNPEANVDPKLLMCPSVVLTRIEEDPTLRIVSPTQCSPKLPSRSPSSPSPTSPPNRPSQSHHLPTLTKLLSTHQPTLTKLLSTHRPLSSSSSLSSTIPTASTRPPSSINSRSLQSSSSPLVQSTITPQFLFNIKTRALLKKCKPCVVLLERLELEGAEPQGGGNTMAKRVELPDIDEVRRNNRRLRTAQVAPLTAECFDSATESCDSDWSPEEEAARAQELKQFDAHLSRLLKGFVATTPTTTAARKERPKKSHRKKRPQPSTQHRPQETSHPHTTAHLPAPRPPRPPPPAPDAQPKTLTEYAREIRDKLNKTSRRVSPLPAAAPETTVARPPALIEEELPEHVAKLNAFKDFHMKMNMLAQGTLPAPPPYPGHGRPAPPRRDPAPPHRDPAPPRRDPAPPRLDPAPPRLDPAPPRLDPAPLRPAPGHFDPVITAVCSLAPQKNRHQKTGHQNGTRELDPPRNDRVDNPHPNFAPDFPPKAVVYPSHNTRLPRFESIRDRHPRDVPPLRRYRNESQARRARANDPRNLPNNLTRMPNMVQQYPQVDSRVSNQRFDGPMGPARFTSPQMSDAPWNNKAGSHRPAYLLNPNFDLHNPSQANCFITPPRIPPLGVPGFQADHTQGSSMPAGALQPNIMYGITINSQPNFAMQRQTFTGGSIVSSNSAGSKSGAYEYYGGPNTVVSNSNSLFGLNTAGTNASLFGLDGSNISGPNASLELTCSNTAACKVSLGITGSNTGSNAITGFSGSNTSRSKAVSEICDSNAGSKASFYGFSPPSTAHEVPLNFDSQPRQSVIINMQPSLSEVSEPGHTVYEVEITPEPMLSPCTETTSSEGSASNEPTKKCWRWSPVPASQWALNRDPLTLVVLGTRADRRSWPLLGRYLVVSEREPPPRHLDVWALSPRVRLGVPPEPDAPTSQPSKPSPAPPAPPSDANTRIKVKSFARLDRTPPKEVPAVLGGDALAPSRVSWDGCTYLKLGVNPLIYAKLLVAVSDAASCRALLQRGAPLLLYCLRSCRLYPLRAEPTDGNLYSLSGPSAAFPALQALVQALQPDASSGNHNTNHVQGYTQ